MGDASTYKYQLGVYNVFTCPESEFATVVKVYQAVKESVANVAKVVEVADRWVAKLKVAIVAQL